jgi:1-deoxy-D-xylulose-5-phosphate reductoisomerase
MKKTITILGSTGSIGKSALRVIKSVMDEYEVIGLSCFSNIEIIRQQVSEFTPKYVAVECEKVCRSERFLELKKQFPHVKFLEGKLANEELASIKTDVCLSAIVGSAGLKPSLAALQSTKRIALANKETLVMAGKLFLDEAKKNNCEIIPVDSEHNAIFLLLNNIEKKYLNKIILTASGGSLRDYPIDELDTISPQTVFEHPTWDMGPKITVDSATLVNKGLEVIEAHHLFDIDYDNIEVLLHHESIIHSLVETVDGSLYAYMSIADMALPILNALNFPKRVCNNFGKLNLKEIGTLTFSELDEKRYPAFSLCIEAGKIGGTAPAVLNAANEIAVENFLKEKILFTQIVKVIEHVIHKTSFIKDCNLEDVLNADKEARIMALNFIGSI